MGLCGKKIDAASDEGSGNADKSDEKEYPTINHLIKASLYLNLPLSQYQNWYDAIADDDRDRVQEILAETDNFEKYRLLNGWFVYDTIPGLNTKICDAYMPFKAFEMPLVLAVVGGSENVLRYFIDIDCSVLQEDIGGNNVVHAMILSAENVREMTAVYLRMFHTIMDQLSLQNRTALLMQENRDGLRPVELAGALAQFHFMQAILDTEQVTNLICFITFIKCHS